MTAGEHSDPQFYGLLKLPPSSERMANLPAGRDPVDIYLRCASLCGASFRHFGYAWTLLTDDAGAVSRRCRTLGIDNIEPREIPFTRDVPGGIAFHSAHYKLDVLAWLGAQEGTARRGLVDLDAVCLAPLPGSVLTASGLAGYCITDSIPPGQEEAAADSIAILLGRPSSPEWWGGEFLLGAPEHFAALSKRIETLWPAYRARHAEMFHSGDEMLVTAALADMRHAGEKVLDAGAEGAVHRFWSARTLNRFPPFSLGGEASILHLPADKPFLAAQARLAFDPAGVKAAYRRRLQGKIMLRRAAGLLDRLRGRATLYPPRL